MAIDLMALRPGGAAQKDSGSVAEAEPVPVSPTRKTRSQNIQRLQIGLSGLAGIMLLIALAGIIKDRVDETEATIVADAGSDGVVAPETQNDALVDAGLVPDLPAEPQPEPAADSAASGQIGGPEPRASDDSQD